MRKIFLISLLSMLTATGFSQKVVHALFIGNSYTGVNNLPQTVADLATSMGDSLIFDAYTPGGYTLQMHSTDATTLQKIAQGGWDYVILQAQSQEPSFSPLQVATNTLPYAQLLDSLITKTDSCTETVFYMTWGRKNGDASNCAVYPPVCTYAGMQERLRESYLLMAQQNHATAAPVGCAWREVRATNPVFDLYQADESHPSQWGTYLAACTFYNILFQKSPSGANFISTIPLADAVLIQQVVAATVADSLSQWCGNGDIPFVNFSTTQFGTTVSCTNTGLNCSAYSWSFGDGSTDTVPDPVHTYIQNGTYVITLTAGNGCKSATFTDTVVINSVGIDATQHQNINVVMNHLSGNIVINGLSEKTFYTFELMNTSGQKILEKQITPGSNTIAAPNGGGVGIYIIRQGRQAVQSGKIVF